MNLKEKTLSIIKSYDNLYMKKDLLSIYLKKEIFINKIFNWLKKIWFKKENLALLKNIKDRLLLIDNVYIDNEWKDIYFKTRSIWCTYCTLWKWCTIVLSYKCHRDCFFCYEESPLNPKVIIDPYNKIDMDKIYNTIDKSFADKNNKTLAITWGEPLLFLDKVYELFEYVNSKYPWKIKRIYTTWDFLTEEKIIKLKSLWLDEFRFSIKPWERPNINLYKLAKKYIKSVLIEMPVLPWTKDYLIDIFEEININNCIDWINLNELTFNNLNHSKYINEWLKLDLRDSFEEFYHRYYNVPKIEIWVSWSKITCLEVLEYFSKKESNFFIHYCDLDTVSKHHYLYKINNAKSLSLNYWTITRFWLIKVCRIYWDVYNIIDILNEKNIKNIWVYKNFVELDASNLLILKPLFKNIVLVYKDNDNLSDIDFELID